MVTQLYAEDVYSQVSMKALVSILSLKLSSYELVQDLDGRQLHNCK